MAAAAGGGDESPKKDRKPKNRHGLGSIEERNGRYYGRLMVGRRDDGRREEVTASGTDRRRVQAELIRKAEEWKRGAYVAPARQTYAEYALGYWLEHHTTRRGQELAPGTRVRYAAALRRYIVPALGRYRLDAIRAQQYQAYLTGLRRAGLNQETQALHDRIARITFAAAVRWGLLPLDPTRTIPRVLPPRPRPRALSEAQRAAFLDAISAYRGGVWLPYVQLVALTGARRIEMLYLEWAGVDWERRVARLTRSKTEAGLARELQLTEPALDALRRQRARQNEWKLAAGPDWQQSDLVFTTEFGERWSESAPSVAFRRAARAAGLSDDWSLKHLRSTFLSVLAEQGVHPRVAQDLAGHADLETTMRFYTAVSPETRRKAVEDVADALLGIPGDGRKSS